jgi:iron(III) transport system permease protein
MTTTQARRPQGVRRSRVAGAALAVAVVCALPLVVILVQALGGGWSAAVDQVLRPRVGELLGNTVGLVLLTVTACAATGVTTAWLVERTDLPGATWWRVAFVAPLAVPAFVNAYAWVSLRPSLSGLGGAVLITTLSYFPFVFLPVSAVLRALDRSWEDSARSLGLGAWRTFWRIVLPQLRPAVLGGALLVALHLLAEFGVLAMLRFPTFTTAILDQYEAAFDTDGGSVLAVVLMSLCATVLFAEYLARGHRRHARVGGGVQRRGTEVRLRRWRMPSLLLVAALALLALGIPLYSIVHWLGRDGAPVFGGSVLASLGSTVGLALAAASVTTVAAFPVALLLQRRPTMLSSAIERITYFASSLPGVVIALALVTVAIRWVEPLYQSPLLLVMAYAVLFIPRAMVSIRAALAHAPAGLIEAARALGSSPVEAIRRVIVPLSMPGILAGFAMVFIATSTELTATLLLAPTGTTTLATGFWAASDSLDYAGAAPYALLMVLVSAPLTAFLLRRPEEVS